MLKPIINIAPSLSEARQALRELRSDEGGSSTSRAATQLSRQLQSLRLGQLLLRCALANPYNFQLYKPVTVPAMLCMSLSCGSSSAPEAMHHDYMQCA